MVQDHERLVPYFGERTELALLDRVYVQLQVKADLEVDAPGEAEDETSPARGPWSPGSRAQSTLRDLSVTPRQPGPESAA